MCRNMHADIHKKIRLGFYYCVYRCVWYGWMQEFFLLCGLQGMNSDVSLSSECLYLSTESFLTRLSFFLLASFTVNPWMTWNLLALSSWGQLAGASSLNHISSGDQTWAWWQSIFTCPAILPGLVLFLRERALGGLGWPCSFCYSWSFCLVSGVLWSQVPTIANHLSVIRLTARHQIHFPFGSSVTQNLCSVWLCDC